MILQAKVHNNFGIGNYLLSKIRLVLMTIRTFIHLYNIVYT